MMTKHQAQMLSTLAVAARPHGAPHWDAPGVMAALAKVNHLALADIAMATMRAASDRTAETPAVIAATNSLHWRERVAETVRSVAPRREDQCRRCGRTLDACSADNGCGEREKANAKPTKGDPTTGLTACRVALGQRGASC